MVKNILLAGVGGQGALLASRVLAVLVMQKGLDVKVSEVHGMAQRGGSVVTHLRFGEKVFSPLIEEGDAHFLVAFEKLEGIRWLPYLRPDGIMIANEQEISPAGLFKYPQGYPKHLKERVQRAGIHSFWLDALDLAQKAGNPKAVNIVLLGVLSNYLHFSAEEWDAALEESIPPKFFEINKRAFNLGRSACKQVLECKGGGGFVLE